MWVWGSLKTGAFFNNEEQTKRRKLSFISSEKGHCAELLLKNLIGWLKVIIDNREKMTSVKRETDQRYVLVGFTSRASADKARKRKTSRAAFSSLCWLFFSVIQTLSKCNTFQNRSAWQDLIRYEKLDKLYLNLPYHLLSWVVCLFCWLWDRKEQQEKRKQRLRWLAEDSHCYMLEV